MTNEKGQTVSVGSSDLLAVGDFVRYKPRRGLLRSGCGQYDRAVVASLSPFVLVSEWGDMRWSATVSPEDFEKCGEADRSVILAVLDRFKRELFPANGRGQMREEAPAGLQPNLPK